jgi:hypothetical protein
LVREFSESGLSQKEFALKVGVHPLTVARWVESCSGKPLTEGPTSTSPAFTLCRRPVAIWASSAQYGQS